MGSLAAGVSLTDDELDELMTTSWNMRVATVGPGDRINVRNFASDEPVNGRWTLRVEDLAAGTSGTFDSWEMDIISRWD